MVQHQHIGAGVEERRDVLAEVTGAHRGANRRHGLPAEGLGGLDHRLFLGPAPGVVGGQMIGDAVLAVGFAEHRPERDTGLIGVEEMAEAILLLVLAGGVVGVGQAGHVNDAHLLAEALLGDGHSRRRAAGDHHRAVALDHAAGRVAAGIGLGLVVAGNEGDLLAQNAAALQRLGREGRDQAAVTATVQVLDGQLIGALLVGALIGIGAGERHVEAQRHAVAAGRVAELLGVGAPSEHQRRDAGRQDAGKAALQHAAAAEVVRIGH